MNSRLIIQPCKTVITVSLFIIVMLWTNFNVFAQKKAAHVHTDIYDIGKNMPKFINTPDSVIKVHVLEEVVSIEPDPEKTYYWFTLNKIHQTRGGYSGKLLDGLYECFNADNDILERGKYELGLKDGQWMRWYKNGLLQEMSNWDKGSRNGEQVLYNNKGQIEFRNYFLNNLLNGKCIVYQQDTVSVINQYKKGKLVKTIVPKGQKK